MILIRDSDPMVGYITGYDATLQSCFYLKTDAGYTASGYKTDNSYTNVVGLTKGQMKASAAYTGFDFDEVWTIDPNADYPYPTLSPLVKHSLITTLKQRLRPIRLPIRPRILLGLYQPDTAKEYNQLF